MNNFTFSLLCRFNTPHNNKVSQGIRQQLNAAESSSAYNQDQVNRTYVNFVQYHLMARAKLL